MTDDFDSISDMMETSEEEYVQKSEVRGQESGGTMSDMEGTVRESGSVEGSMSDISGTMADTDAGSASSREEWQVGDVIEDLYEVKGSAAGAMGRVYFVHHKNWNTMLAMKTPLPHVYQDEKDKADYIREAESWIEIGMHPNVVSAFYVRKIEDIPRIFLEYVDGGDLREWMKAEKVKDLKTILDIAVQVSEGMEQAHRKDLIHRDLKPENIMMTKDGMAKVTDLGLASAESSSGGGTPLYMSPEQWTRDLTVGTAADIYAFGCILYEMLAGRPVFRPEGANRQASLKEQHCGTEPKPLPVSVPAELKDFVMSCLVKDVASRPQSFEPMSDRLREIYRVVVGEEYPREEPDEVQLLADGLNNRALSMLDLGRQEEAKRLFEDALHKDSGHLESVYNFGLCQWRRGELSDQDFVGKMESICRSQQDSSGRLLLSYIHLARTDPESALAELSQARAAEECEEAASALAVAKSLMLRAPQCIKTIDPECGWIYSVHLNKEGSRLLVGGGQVESSFKLQLWDLERGTCLQQFRHEGESCYTAVTSSFDLVLSGTDNRNLESLHLWDLNKGSQIRACEKSGAPASLALSSDGRFGLSCDEYSPYAIRLWDMQTGCCLKTYEGHTGPVSALAFSRDDQLFLSGGHDKTLRLWDARSGRLIRVIFDGKRGTKISCVALSNDSSMALVAHGQMLILWDTKGAGDIRTFSGHKEAITCFAATADWQFIVSGSCDKTLRIWHTDSGRCIRTFDGLPAPVECVAMTSTGSLVASGDRDCQVRIYDISSLCSSRPGRFIPPYSLCRTQNSNVLALNKSRFKTLIDRSAGHLSNSETYEAMDVLRLARCIPGHERAAEAMSAWALLARRCKRGCFKGMWSSKSLGGNSHVRCSALAIQGRHLLAGSDDGKLHLWDCATGSCLRTMEGHRYAPKTVVISEDGAQALSGSSDSFRTWDLVEGLCTRVLEKDDSAYMVSNVQWGLNIAVSSHDETITIWDLDAGVRVKELASRGDIPRIGADGRLLCLLKKSNLEGSGCEIGVWDIAGDEKICSIVCQRSYSANYALANDNELLLVGAERCFLPSGGFYRDARGPGVVSAWSIPDGECLWQKECHSGDVSVVLSPDDRYVLSYDTFGKVCISDAKSGHLVGEITGQAGISAAAFQDDGWGVAISCYGKLCLWQLDWELDVVQLTDWDKGARPYLDIFLMRHTPYGLDRLTRHGKPCWTEEEFQGLIKDLQYRGFGWLRPEGVRQKLEEMASNWTGPPPLFGEKK